MLCWTIETSTGEHSLNYSFLSFSWHVYYHSCLHTCIFHHECVTIRSCCLGVGAHVTNCSSRAWVEHKASWDEEEVFLCHFCGDFTTQSRESKYSILVWCHVQNTITLKWKSNYAFESHRQELGRMVVSANTWSGTFSSFMRKKTVVKWLPQFILTGKIWLKRL